MRWLVFGILAAVVVVAQTSLAWRLEVGPVRPDWAIVLVVFYVMHAVSFDALLAAWTLGILLDLCSDARLGLFALTFGMTAMAIVKIRHLFFEEHLLTHLFVTLSFALLVYAGIGVYRLLYFPESTSLWTAVFLLPLLTGIYAAAWALPGYYLFARLRYWMGLKPAKRRR